MMCVLAHIMNEKVYAAQVGCEQCKGPHYTKDCPLTKEGTTLEEAYYTQFGGPFQGGRYRVAAPGFYQRNNVNPSYQERRQSMEDTLSKFMSESAKRPEENSNLIKEIRASTDAAIRNQGASFKTLEIFFGVSVMPLSTYLNLGLGELAHTKLIVELADRTVTYPKGIAKNVLVGIGKFVFEDIKITLRIREERIIFKSVKPASSLIMRVYMLSLRERIEFDLGNRLLGESLVINRSLDPLNGDYIKLNDLNEPFKLRRNQGDDLMPTIEEGELIEEFRTRDDELDIGIDDYPSCCDYDKKIHIDYAHNLKFSCMIGFEFTHVNFFLLLYVNVKDKMVYKENNVIGALMNGPIFVGMFSVVTDFAVLEDMDAYRDEGMGDVIFGKPFLRDVGIKARRFEGMITIYNGNKSVTYQMVRSHPRFKHHINEQCNKIPLLLKISDEDKKNGISHLYQKFKGFYKRVLNLGLDYIQDAKTEEWLTCGHISVHEMKW
ncbi:hypothetical protein Tco_0088208 [Tanacetum coccineum]